jgi:hypothetical protein
MLLALSVAAVFVLLAGNIAAQSTGPAAFAAKQEIKNQVLAAMSDGKITPDERRNILSHAKNILSANEYVGLVNTMNRLSPPDHSVPEDLGYTPVVDKQLMANFPVPDLSRFNKLKLGEALSNQSFVKEIMPKQTFVVKETTPKQTYIVKEIITKQTIVEAAPPNQSVAKATTPKQTVATAATPKQTAATATAPKQTIAKTAKPNAAAKTADIVIIPPPPPLLEDDNQPKPATVGRVQKSAKAENPAPPMPPPAERSQTHNAPADKPVQQKISASPMKRPATGDQVAIKQPAGLLNVAERSAIAHFYADYSVPVLTTPAAALLTDRNTNTIQASFDQLLEPESGQSIIRQ